jgi:hypothetical protein
MKAIRPTKRAWLIIGLVGCIAAGLTMERGRLQRVDATASEAPREGLPTPPPDQWVGREAPPPPPGHDRCVCGHSSTPRGGQGFGREYGPPPPHGPSSHGGQQDYGAPPPPPGGGQGFDRGHRPGPRHGPSFQDGRRGYGTPPPRHGSDGMGRGPAPGGRDRRDSYGQPAPSPRGVDFGGRRGAGAGGPDGHRPPPPEQMFEDMDANGDGMLSRNEFMQFHERHRPPHGPRGQRPPSSPPESSGEEGQPPRGRP